MGLGVEVDVKPQKALHVSLDGYKPQFVFTGDWTGHDIKAILANIRREYNLHNVSLRRSDQTKEQKLT